MHRIVVDDKLAVRRRTTRLRAEADGHEVVRIPVGADQFELSLGEAIGNPVVADLDCTFDEADPPDRLRLQRHGIRNRGADFNDLPRGPAGQHRQQVAYDIGVRAGQRSHPATSSPSVIKSPPPTGRTESEMRSVSGRAGSGLSTTSDVTSATRFSWLTACST